MNDMNMEERIAIRDSARTLKKYGSTSNYVKKQESYVKHQVVQNDTLQGLALKYGVTTEQIRRANKLWANDSIFLRKTLLIPVTLDALISPNDVLLVESEQSTSNGNNGGAESESSYNDFLVRIDCAIASTKSQVMVAQDNSEFVDGDSIFWKRKSPMSRLKQHQKGLNSNCTTSNGVDVPTVVTKGRKVKSSLQRLEKEQDEMFEL